jgi:metal-sulfur cluster biosynthetic enzyme
VDITDAKEKKNTSHKKKTQKTEEQKLEKKWNDLRKWVETVPDFSIKSEKDKINIVNSIMIKKYGKTIEVDTEDLLF